MQLTRLLKNKVTMKTGKTIFWTGFIITIGIIIAYLLTMIIGVAAFAGWIVSLSLCGIVMVGAILMIIGHNSLIFIVGMLRDGFFILIA